MSSILVSGVLVNPFNRPLPNAIITLTSISNSFTVLTGANVTSRTNDAGEYEFHLQPGNYAVYVAKDSYRDFYGAITITATTPPTTLNVLLKQNAMEAELPPDLVEFFQQVQNQVVVVGNGADEAARIASEKAAAAAVSEQNSGAYSDVAGQAASSAGTSAAVAEEIANKLGDLEQLIRDAGYSPVDSFERGNILTSIGEALRVEATGIFYSWRGEYPKIVPPGSTPETTGGISQTAWVDVNDLTLRSTLAQPGGAGVVRTESGKTVQEEITTVSSGFYDSILFDASNVNDAFTQHNHVLLRTSVFDTRLMKEITIPPYKKLTVLSPKGANQVVLRGSGKKFILQRGAEIYAPNLSCADYDMDVITIDGSSRPSMILAISEWPKIKVNIQSEYKRGRGVVMDASTNPETNKSGIITSVIVDAVVRGMHTAYEEVLYRNGTETDKTYINNNCVNLTAWQCVRGLIQAKYEHGVDPGVEIAANHYELNYQTNADSVDVLHVYGVRNIVSGIIWDYDYPSLHAQSILIKGNSNVIGSRNFPSITNVNVTADSFVTSRNSYTGATYGTDRHDAGQFNALWKPYHFAHPDDALITMPSSLFMLQSERTVGIGNLVSLVTRRVYYRSINRLPFSMNGFVIIRNHSATTANVRVAIGLSNTPGEHALSQTYTIAPASMVRVPLLLYLTSDRLYGESGTTVWYGYPAYNNVDGYINVNLSLTTDTAITVAGCYLTLSKYGY